MTSDAAKAMKAHHDQVMGEHFRLVMEQICDDDRIGPPAKALISAICNGQEHPITVAITGLWAMGWQLAASMGQPDQSIKEIFCFLVDHLADHKPPDIARAQAVMDAQAEAMADAAPGGRGGN